MRNENYDINGNTKNYLLQVESGGTGVSDPESALEVLGAVAVDAIGVNNGVVGLDEFGYIKEQYFPSSGGGAASITLYGPNTVALNSSVIIEITNYDVFTSYHFESYKLEVQRDAQFILVTGKDIGNDAWFSVNGSVFEVQVTIDNSGIKGVLENSINFPGETELGSVASNSDGSLVLVSLPTKTVKGSEKAGEVRLYSYSKLRGYEEVFTASPTLNPVALVYSGRGVKNFTVNNQKTTRTDASGTLTYTDTGSVIITATGEQIYSTGTPQQGLPAYPNGLPVYRPASGNPAYPNGLPVYSPSVGNISYPNGLPVYRAPAGSAGYPQGLPAYSVTYARTSGTTNSIWLNASFGVLEGVYIAFPDGTSPNMNWIRGNIISDPGNRYGPGWVTDLGTAPALGPSAPPPYRGSGSGWTYDASSMSHSAAAKVAVAFRSTLLIQQGINYVVQIPWGSVTQKGLPSYPSGLPVYAVGQGNSSYPSGLPPYRAAQGNASYPNGLAAYIPVQGNINYPSGLPPYVPAQPPRDYQDKIVVKSEVLNLDATTIDTIYYPWANFDLGRSVDLQGQVMAMGCPREANNPFANNGEVMVSRRDNDIWSHQRLSIPKTTPYGAFGKSLKLTDFGNSLTVGCPGRNLLYHYKFENNTYVQKNTTTISSVSSTANFGISFDISLLNERMVVGAPGMGNNGTLYVFDYIGGVWVWQSTITLTFPEGHVIGHNVRLAGNGHIYASVKTPTNSNNYLVELTIGDNYQWEQTHTFQNPNSGGGTENFGDVFDVAETHDILYVASKGNATTKGYTQIWVQDQGEWIYYKTMTASESRFGDGFSASIAINEDGKGGHFLTNNGSTGAIGYYK